MFKEIDCLIPIITLLHSFSDNHEKLTDLDALFLKMLENDVLCKYSDFFLLGEKLKKIMKDQKESLNILYLNGQALGLIDMDNQPKIDKTETKLIDGLFETIEKIKSDADNNKLLQQAVNQTIDELLNNNVDDPKKSIKRLLS